MATEKSGGSLFQQLGGQGGDLVGCFVLTAGFRYLGVNTALQTTAELKPVPGVAVGEQLRRMAPENTGKIVRTSKSPGDSQHNVTDLPAKRGTAVGGFPAEGTFQKNVIDRVAVFTDEGIGKDEDQKMAAAVTADIVRANLPGNSKHFTAGKVGGVENTSLGNDGKGVYGAGKTGNIQKKAKKTEAVIFVGEFREGMEAAPKGDLIDCMFQSTTSN